MNKVLLVDSDEEACKLYQLILRNSCELHICKTIEEAQLFINSTEVKVVIADSMQVSTSVLEFLEQLANNKPDIQRILVTVNTAYHLIGEAINKCRIFQYISKPLEPKKLIMIVQKAIEQYDLNIENIKLLKELKNKNKELSRANKELKLEEEKFRKLYYESPDSIFIIQRNGTVLDLNYKSSTIFNKKETSLNPFSLYSLVAVSKLEIFNQYLSKITSGIPTMIEFKLKTKENQWVDYEINGLQIIYKGKQAYMLTCRDLSERKAWEKQKLHSIIQTEEKERRRFSQELHDGIGPLLSTTKLYLQWFNRPDAKLKKSIIISKMEETLDETIKSVREISNNISPNTLQNFGLNTALKTFIARVSQASSINFEYKNKVDRKLPRDIEVTLYRLICECINNSIKHAEASQIIITILDQQDVVNVNFSDNGKGFNVDEILSSNKGNGLLNMKSRVLSLGGSYEITSSKDNGTQIYLSFNCNDQI